MELKRFAYMSSNFLFRVDCLALLPRSLEEDSPFALLGQRVWMRFAINGGCMLKEADSVKGADRLLVEVESEREVATCRSGNLLMFLRQVK